MGNHFVSDEIVSEGSQEIGGENFNLLRERKFGKNNVPFIIDYSKIKIHPSVVDKLYDIFTQQTEGKLEMTKEKFRTTYGSINKKLERYIFNVICPPGSASVTFPLFLQTLSTTYYGTKEEKTKLICKMLDLNKKGKIRSKNTYEFIEGISLMLNASKEKKRELTSFVENIFKVQSEEKELITLENGIVVDGNQLSSTMDIIDKIQNKPENVEEEIKESMGVTEEEEEESKNDQIIDQIEKEELNELKKVEELPKNEEVNVIVTKQLEEEEEEEEENEEEESIKIADKFERPIFKDRKTEQKLRRKSLSMGDIPDNFIFDTPILDEVEDFSDFEEADEMESSSSEEEDMNQTDRYSLKRKNHFFSNKQLGLMRQDSKLNLKKLLEEKKKDAIKIYNEKKKEITEKVIGKAVELEEKYDKEIGKLNEQKEKLNQKIDEATGVIILTYDEFIKRGMNQNDFLNCFGLFDKMNETITKIEGMIETKFDLSGIEYKFDKPTYTGSLYSSFTDNKRFGNVCNGFLSFYKGKDAKNNLINRKPSMVINLQEAQILRLVNMDTESKYYFSITIPKPKYRQTFYKLSEQEADKWVWILRRNTGFKRFRFQSSFPLQISNSCDFFISGKNYFEDLSTSLKLAKSEIFICGWMISPHLYFTRDENKQTFGEILEEVAKKNVKIRILIWADPQASFLIDLGSSYVEQYLSKLHENIMVIRDPKYTVWSFWSHHQKSIIIDQEIAYVGGVDIAYNRYENPDTYPLFDHEKKEFFGMDYVNPMLDMRNLGDNLEDYIDRKKIPRMPWQDIAMKVVGLAARDVSKNFIQRWNLANRSGKFPLLLKSTQKINQSKLKYENCKVQVLRSASKWSFGLEIPERSIYEAHIELIENSEHYIYIENQFFISSSSDSQVNPQNRIVSALISRLRRAIEKKKKFKLIVMLPLQPATPTMDTSTQIIIYWQYTTIFRGDNSIFSILQKDFPKVNLDDYIFFCSMRNYGYPSGSDLPVTEMIYIHTKMLIVDDKYALIGSANLNDRSMHGCRDSELALIVEDEKKVEIKMDGKKYLVNQFAHELRTKCWMKYLGRQTTEGMEDPIQFFDKFVEIANKNTDIFNKVFKTIHSTITTESELQHLINFNQKDKVDNLELLDDLEGYLVTYPKGFLSKSKKNQQLTKELDSLFI
eukprot:gene6568-10731_t